MYKPYPFTTLVTNLARVSLVLIALSPTEYSVSLARPKDQPKANTANELVASQTGSVAASADGWVDIAQLPATRSPASGVSRAGAPPAEAANTAEAENDWFGLLTSTAFIVTMIFGLASLLFLRWRRSKASAYVVENDTDDFGFSDFDSFELADKPEVETGLIKTNGADGSSSSNGFSAPKKSVVRLAVSVPASMFGAFQVDQEVAKLVLGQSHRMEVLASRAPDDQRAVEASLLKALAARDEDERYRVREALEEYGFVARQNAAVLSATDAYERTSAAKMLGHIRSPSALPFLLEALYDNDSIVRNQAVQSIGELGLPSALGALLDVARKHNDLPSALLSRALSACSVEGLDFIDNQNLEPGLPTTTDLDLFSHEVKKLEPAAAVQDLPESVDDQQFVGALTKLQSLEIAERAEGVILLAQFAVRESVTALARVARRDAKANLRSLAISSLATINHESVFPSVLIGMADESREVRAAAARSLTRLSFDRADAYIRVMETDDAATLREVAQACVKAGVATQGIDRLGSTDRRQAYEAFSLVSLLAKADVLEPILAAIVNHPSVEVRLGAVRLLGTTGDPGVLQELREIVDGPMPQPVKIALAETIAKLEAAMSKASQETEVESAALPDQTEGGVCDQDQNESDSAEILRAPHEGDAANFLSQQDELGSAECDSEHSDPAAAETLLKQHVPDDSVFAQNDSDDVDGAVLSEQHEAEIPESEREAPLLSFLERISEQPVIETAGPPALPLA